MYEIIRSSLPLRTRCMQVATRGRAHSAHSRENYIDVGVGLIVECDAMAPSPCSCLVVTAFLLLLLPRLDLACRGLDCGMGYCLEGKDGSYRCICLGGYGGNRCDQIVATPSRREAEASPCDESPCENGGECMPVPTEEVIDRADVGFGESEMECEVEGNCYVCICTAAFAGPNCLIRKNNTAVAV